MLQNLSFATYGRLGYNSSTHPLSRGVDNCQLTYTPKIPCQGMMALDRLGASVFQRYRREADPEQGEVLKLPSLQIIKVTRNPLSVNNHGGREGG